MQSSQSPWVISVENGTAEQRLFPAAWTMTDGTGLLAGAANYIAVVRPLAAASYSRLVDLQPASLSRLFIYYSIILAQQQIPHSLFKEKGYDHREALFGMPPYGGSIAQQVYYANSDLCDDFVDPTKGYPQREKDGKTGKQKPWEAPFILMVDRGGCTFVKKVR